jgi:hypothetical protein
MCSPRADECQDSVGYTDAKSLHRIDVEPRTIGGKQQIESW